MKSQLQQEEAALQRQCSALSRRLADAAAGDVLAAVERDRTTNLEKWADSMEARAGGNRPALASADGQTATCAGVEVPPGAPEWVMLMPAGRLNARDGRRWRLTDADAVVNATRAGAAGLDLPIDFEHQTQLAAKNGQPAPAAGWIRQLQARAGALWAHVEWTARAAAMLKAREYRYLSPTFFHTRDGIVMRIEGAALTNAPALAMPALASNGVAAGPAGTAGGDPNAPLTADELAGCRSLGISEEKFRESRAADLIGLESRASNDMPALATASV